MGGRYWLVILVGEMQHTVADSYEMVVEQAF